VSARHTGYGWKQVARSLLTSESTNINFWREIKKITEKEIASRHSSVVTRDKKDSSSEVLPKKLRRSS
jgi:hypothetical protein